jgi:hypothetical protein
MARPQIAKVYECGAEPWALPNDATEVICLLAGREASAALCIALGKHRGASAAQKASFNEPFTYWDWHGVSPDDTYAQEEKRQRFWEHQRGFIVNGTESYGYPTSRERWQRFVKNIEDDPKKGQWVKRIAVAHWMLPEDLNW